MDPTTVGLIGLVVLIIALFSRMPVGFVMALVGFLGFSYLVSLEAGLRLFAKDIFVTFGSYSLTVVPLFILMGQIAFHAGISRRLYDSAYTFLGHFPGGLAMATIGACAGFAAICGSTNAAAATMATVALPEMKRYKYGMELATGSVAAGGSLGILIPPSVIFIIYGIMTEQSIGKLFAAGILPGVLLSVLFILTIYIRVRMKPVLGPPGPKTSLREKLQSLSGVIEMLLIFGLVMGGLFRGFFTPTEAGAAGVFITLMLAVSRRHISWEKFLAAIWESVRISCMVLVIVAGATVFGHFLAVTRIPYILADWVAGLPLPPWAIIGVIVSIYLIGGCFMDSLAMILLTIPIFYPVAVNLGYDPIWFGVIIVLITEMGVITPPVGVNVYVVSGVAKDIPLEIIFKGILPLLGALIVCNIILIIFPQIALFLPSLMR
ncbi:MAG: TRAP transporter large permease [Desulfobacterales bacterium]|nr:TRAP transporter large permease [Desulfobacterales bacterium]